MIEPVDFNIPELGIDIAVDEPLWDGVADHLNRLLEKALCAAFVAGWPRLQDAFPEHDGDRPVAEVSLVLTDDQSVRSLNLSYRQQDKATNVLAFAALDEGDVVTLPKGAPIILGDIIVGYGVTHGEAKDKKISVSSHLCHLVVHGMLHLLGYDHLNDDDAQDMETMETLVLKRLGIHDPYAATIGNEVINGGVK